MDQDTNFNSHEKKAQTTNPKKIREVLPIWGTSIGWASGRSSIFTFLAYWGVVLGASPLEQSILTSVRNLGSNIFQSIWGWLADLKGRKLVIFIGLITLSITTMIAPFVRNPFELVLISIIMTSIGFSIIPAWNSFLGDYSTERFRASFIGKINSIGTLSSVFLIIFLGILMDMSPFPFPREISVYNSSKPVFFIPFITGALIFGLTIFISYFLVEKYSIKDKMMINEEIQPSWRVLIRRNIPFRRLLPFESFFKFAMSMAWPIFPFVTLRVADSWTMVGFLWAIFHFPRSIGQNYGGKLADKYGKKPIIILSRLGYGFVPLGYALGVITGNPVYLFLSNIPGGLAFGAEDTSIASYSLDCSTEDTKARYYSILLTAGGISAFIGSLFAGFIMDLWLYIINIDYSDSEFNIILIGMLFLITFLRFLSAILHKFIYENPLDFEFNYFSD